MAETPKLRSPETIYGDLVDGFTSRARNVTDLSKQSVLNQLIKAVSESNFRAVADIIQSIDALNIDRAIGDALQRLARDRNVPILSGRYSSGRVDITDTTFTKIESAIFAGQPAPIGGSQVIYVADASKFTATGKLYIGRNTPNVEGPLDYISIASQGGGAYWAITLAPTSLTTKYHNVGEKVIFAQGGNRLINANAGVQTASGSSAEPITFKTTSNATIQDGETTVYNVPIVCNQIGTAGNVPKGSIRETVSLPFDSVANNSQPFTNGMAPDNDDTLRDRIKAYEQAKSKGTEAAIKVSAIDVVSDDDLKRVTSSNVIRYSDLSSALIFDDGTGYESIFNGVGLEKVIDKALGGETNLQLRQYPLTQARVINNVDGPFNINDGDTLDIDIQGVRKSHIFYSTDFKVQGAATVSEIVDSINSDPNFHAYATGAINTTRIALYPRERTQNEITVKSRSTIDANVHLGFPVNTEYTIRLYKNDIALYQDGLVAKVSTSPKANWVNTITAGDTLIYSVDNAPSITTTFTTDSFQAVSLTSSVSSFTSIEIWAAVMNTLMAGCTATVNGDVIEIKSNLGQDTRASIYISGGTIYSKMFPANTVLAATGRSSDFNLNINTGQLELTEPLLAGDSIAAGSAFTRSKISTNSIPNGPTSVGNMWLVSDGNAKGIATGLRLNTTLYFEQYNANPDLLRLRGVSATLTPEGFTSVQVGDWILVWAEAADAMLYPTMYANRGYWRVEQIDNGIVVRIGGNFTPTYGFEYGLPLDRIAVVRSTAPVQHLNYPVSTIGGFINTIKSQMVGIDAEAVGSTVRISTQTSGSAGELFVIAADAGARSLGFASSTIVDNITSHYGFAANQDAEAGTPLFTHSAFGTKTSATEFQETNYVALGGHLDNFAELLNNYETSPLQELPDSNKSRRVLTEDYIGSNVTLKIPPYMANTESPIQASDRYFLRESYQFDANDQVTFIVDGDNNTKTYNTPTSRKIKVNSHSTPSLQDFSASDTESTLALEDPSSFNTFDFTDFKVWRKAGILLSDGSLSIKFNSADFGPAGNSLRVGYVYPTSRTQTSLSYNTINNETGAIGITLPVTLSRTANWDGTTSFTTDVVTTGGRDAVTYTYRVGTAPSLSIGAGVTNGDIAMLDPTSNFLSSNKDFSAKVSAVTPTTFTINRPTGTATSDNVIFSSMINQAGVTTVTSTTSHGITTGDRIGIWNTAAVSGITKPFETTYFPTVTSPNTFTIPTPVTAPTGTIISTTHAGNIVTVTSTAHGLQAGNIVIISNVATAVNGTHPVSNILNANQFQYVVIGSSSPPTGGQFDFQSYAADGTTSQSITSVTKSGYTVTVFDNNNLVTNDLVQITGAVWDAYVVLTTYGIGDMVRYSGIDYVSLVSGNTSNQPNTSPAQWAISSLTLNGNYVVSSAVAGVSFTFTTSFGGNGSSTGTGTAAKMTTAGKLARSIGSSEAKLQFAQVQSTAQDVLTFVSTSMAGVLQADLVTGSLGDLINTSTADNGIGTNYYSVTALNISGTISSNLINITVNGNIAAGSDIILNSSSHAAYNDSYVVLDSVQSGLNYILTLRTAINSTTTFSAAMTGGTVRGTNAYSMFKDGENWVKSSDLQSLPTLPQFSLKRAWSTAPAIDEEIRVIATTNDHLARFWNILSVTGLSNVATINNSEYGRQLQVRTKTFGASGSIQVAGGSATAGQIALIGAGKEQDTTTGSFVIPYEARKGLNSRSWVKLTQTVRQNKSLGFSGTTVIQTFNDGLQITGGTGSFQTLRATTQATGTTIKVERHGDYVAYIGIDGASMGLLSNSTQFVREGDWVKIRNTVSVPFTPSNCGIFQVVRVFGNGTFWIENDLAVDEIVTLTASTEMAFYSYDSVMPDDTLIIAGNILDPLNVGRYLVIDETSAGAFFPTSTRIYTKPIPITHAPTVLGDSFLQVNVEEYKPLSLLKRIVTIAPSSAGYANVIVDSSNLMNKMSSANSAAAIFQNKLAYPTEIQYGVDSYRYYKGLVKQLNKVIYGDSFDSINYPGVRAAGTAIDIKPAILKRITVAMSVRIKSGVPFIELRDRIKAAVAGYVNSLNVGEQVSLSKIVDAAGKINGVTSVVITSPVYDISSDLIYVGLDQRAAITDATNDVTVSILGN